MDGYLRQSTAGQIVTIGPFVDDTDFKTAETALTIANTDIKLKKNGGASASKNSGGATHDVNGNYHMTLDATDSNTVGQLSYNIKVAGALQVWGHFVVLEEAVYDALFAASAPGYVANAPVNVAQFGGTNLTAASGRPEVNVSHFGGSAGTFASGRPEVNTTHAAGTAWGSGAITAASIAADAITAAKIADNAIDAGSIAADAITAAKIADGAIDAATFAAGAINAAAIASAALTSAKFANDTGLASIRSGTAQAGAGTTITLDASASAVDDFYKNCLVYLVSGTGAGQARFISGYVGATKVATVPTWATNPDNTSVFTILPFGSIPGATAPTAAEVADAVWDEATAGHTTSGTFGEQCKTDIDDILTDTGTTLDGRLPAALVGGRIDANVGAISTDATAADNLEAALDGTGGVTISAAVTGNITGNLSGSVGSVTGAVGSVTGNVGGNVAGSVGSVTGAVGSVSGNVGGNVTGSVGSVAAGGIAAASFAAGAIDAAAIAANAIGASELAADAVDEILDETIGDSTVTMRQALKLLVAVLGGKLAGAATTTVTIRNAADTTDVVTATVDANGNRTAVTLSL